MYIRPKSRSKTKTAANSAWCAMRWLMMVFVVLTMLTPVAAFAQEEADSEIYAEQGEDSTTD